MKYLQAHTDIVIGCFPGAGFILSTIGYSMFIYEPVPFSLFIVNEVLLNKMPGLDGLG